MRFHGIVGAEHAPDHLAHQRHRDRRRIVDDFLGELPRLRQQLVGRQHAAHQAAAQGFVGIEDAAGIDPFQRLLRADEARQEPAGGSLHHDAAPREDEADARLGRGEADVHRQRHGGADADRRSVDRADDGLERLEDAQGHAAAAVADRLVGIIGLAVGAFLRLGAILARGEFEGARASREVGAGAEGAALAGDDDDTDIVVRVGLVEGCDHLVHHLPGEGVELVRTMQGDRLDVVFDRDADRFVGHGVSRFCSSLRIGTRRTLSIADNADGTDANCIRPVAGQASAAPTAAASTSSAASHDVSAALGLDLELGDLGNGLRWRLRASRADAATALRRDLHAVRRALARLPAVLAFIPEGAAGRRAGRCRQGGARTGRRYCGDRDGPDHDALPNLHDADQLSVVAGRQVANR